MIIPSQFQLGGMTWKVVKRKRLKGRYGDCDLKKLQIQILDTIPQELKEQTFCHELVHAIKIATGTNPDDHDEKEIDAFATYLHQYFNTAK